MWRRPSAVTTASLTTSRSCDPMPALVATLADSVLAIWTAAALPASAFAGGAAFADSITLPPIAVAAATATAATQHRVERFMWAPRLPKQGPAGIRFCPDELGVPIMHTSQCVAEPTFD